MKLSPSPRTFTRVPQTQSKFFNCSRNFGRSFGSFCKSASSVNRYFPRAALRSGETRRALAAVEREFLHADARVAGGQFLENFPRLVLAAIVGDDDFVGNLQRLDRFADGLDEFAQIAFLVVTRNDEADFGMFRRSLVVVYRFSHSSAEIFRSKIVSTCRNSIFNCGVENSELDGMVWRCCPKIKNSCRVPANGP